MNPQTRADINPFRPTATPTLGDKGRGIQAVNSVVMANVKGFQTNIGDFTHNFVLRHQAPAVAVTEMWLPGEVEPTFGKIPG